MIFDTRVNGIPCQCKVLNYSPSIPMRITGSGMGDCDPPEDAEFDFELLDRRDRKATWLDKYITPGVHSQLFEEFLTTRRAEEYGFY